jgi:hypothetical protein
VDLAFAERRPTSTDTVLARRNAVPESVLSTIDRPGVPLPATDRAMMEAGLGQNFAQVRIHTDALAARSANEIDAEAYSFGNEVVFGKNIYRPGDPRSQQVLAHELTHVIQQPRTQTRPEGIAQSNAPAERAASNAARDFQRGGAGSIHTAVASPGLIHRQTAPGQTPQAPAPPQAQTPAPQSPTPQTTQGQTPQAAPGKSEPQPQALVAQDDKKPEEDLRSSVRGWLDHADFDLPSVAEPDATAAGGRHVWIASVRRTLDWLADQVTDDVGQMMPGVLKKGKRTDGWVHLRTEVWTHVWQYYNEKLREAESSRWQLVTTFLYTPQKNFYSNPAGPTPWQHSLQGTGGANYRLHAAGASGGEVQVAGSISLFDFHKKPISDYVFQNALASVQLQHVWNVGNDFRLMPGTSALFQASIFANIAAGVGSSYGGAEKNKLYIGFLAQPSLGGQVNFNIGWFQVIAQGAVVYSYLSSTSEKGSTPSSSAGAQFGLGIGGQF